ncbi:unnamed protein product [Brassica oleracea var. botrytis]
MKGGIGTLQSQPGTHEASLLLKKHLSTVCNEMDIVFVVVNDLQIFLSQFCTISKFICLVIGFSFQLLYNQTCALSFQLGAMSHGKIECDYVEEFVASKSFSSFTHPL